MSEDEGPNACLADSGTPWGDTDDNCLCTLAAGHDGDHETRNIHGALMVTWARDGARDPRMDPAHGDWFTGPDRAAFIYVDLVRDGTVYYAVSTVRSWGGDLRRKTLDDWRVCMLTEQGRVMTAAEVDEARAEAQRAVST